MKKTKVVITAGPTYEPIDPVRGITNRSTGMMGYEIAKEAVKREYNVTLITGPVSLKAPKAEKVIKVTTASEMKKAVEKEIKNADVLIMAAAVADFRVKKYAASKIKKSGKFTLELIKNPDILKSAAKHKIKGKIGFALESGSLLKNAKKKLKEKGLDMIVANSISKKKIPFGGGRKNYTLLFKNSKLIHIKNATKNKMACVILDTLKNNVL